MGLSPEERAAVLAQRQLLKEQHKPRTGSGTRGRPRSCNEERNLAQTTAAYLDAAREGHFRLTEREAAEHRRVEQAIAELRAEKEREPVTVGRRRPYEIPLARRGIYRGNRR